MNRYDIRVAGHIDQRRADALGCEVLRLHPDGGSQLVFAAADQAALYGLLARLRNAGIELLAIQRVAAPTGDVPGGDDARTPFMEAPDVPR